MEVLDAEMSDDAKGGDGRRETGRALGVEDGREVAHFPVGYSSLIDAYVSAAAQNPLSAVECMLTTREHPGLSSQGIQRGRAHFRNL